MGQIGIFLLCLVAFVFYKMIINLLEAPKPLPRIESEQEKKLREERQLYNETLGKYNETLGNYQKENRNFYKQFIGKKLTEDNWITWKHNLGRLCDQEIRKEAFINGTTYMSLGISRQISVWQQLDLIPGVDYNEEDLLRIDQKTHKLVREVCNDIQKLGHSNRYTGVAPRKYNYDDWK